MGLSTHVLDTARGRPAEGIPLVLERQGADGGWAPVGRGTTDADGRCRALLGGGALEPAVYRLTFLLESWYAAHSAPVFYPRAVIEFRVDAPADHHHIPLLISPFGYSTYRGS